MKHDAKSVDRDDRDLLRVIRFSSAVSLGLMAAFLFSVKQVTPDLKCEFSVGSGVAFLAGMAFSWLFWRVVFKEAKTGKTAGRRKGRAWFAALSVLLSLASGGAFAFALKGVGNEKLMEILQGTVIALFALSGVGFLFWQAIRFLENDSKRATEDAPPPDAKE
ncbi:MAG: hypothetical protein DME19_10400 [Verrucomicrobia bacterium]|nr:MAG: hypothetical protein DME19_10400 [Verrucomicrobiota bacterium]